MLLFAGPCCQAGKFFGRSAPTPASARSTTAAIDRNLGQVRQRDRLAPEHRQNRDGRRRRDEAEARPSSSAATSALQLRVRVDAVRVRHSGLQVPRRVSQLPAKLLRRSTTFLRLKF